MKQQQIIWSNVFEYHIYLLCIEKNLRVRMPPAKVNHKNKNNLNVFITEFFRNTKPKYPIFGIMDINEETFISKVLDECCHDIVDDVHFSWIKRNERACFFVYCLIYRYYFLVYMHVVEDRYNHLALYDKLLTIAKESKIIKGYTDIPVITDSKMRYEGILEYFYKTESSKRDKLLLLRVLSVIWLETIGQKIPFIWLDKKDKNFANNCIWVWDYIKNYKISISYLYPDNDIHELYLSILAAYDCWDATLEEKKIFIKRIKRAWAQKKRRENENLKDHALK